MSRIGKQPIQIPEGITVTIEKGRLRVKGPKGELTRSIPDGVMIEKKDNKLNVAPTSQTSKNRALWGTIRSVVANMVEGVSEGYTKKLEVEGVGYRVQLLGNKLVLNVGFSHPVEITPPEGINFSVEKNTIMVSGIDKVLVGETAARVRATKKPEPYKGKGVRYEGEVVRRKQGKKAVGAGE